MKFHDWFSARDDIQAKHGIQLSHEQAYSAIATKKGVRDEILWQAQQERDWRNAKRPYYNAWPAILPLLTSIKLSIPCDSVHLPLSPLLVRFAQSGDGIEHDCFGESRRLRTMLISNAVFDNGRSGIVAYVDAGCRPGEQWPSKFAVSFHRTPGATVEVSMFDGPRIARDGPPEELLKTAMRVACAVCLIGKEDTSLVTPAVFSEDRRKYEETGDMKYVERAIRRGNVGWDLGREIHEMQVRQSRGEPLLPHYRMPHLALFWTGPGRRTARILNRSGSFVHRFKLTEVPTGYLDDEESA